jgi:hypothetical protein
VSQKRDRVPIADQAAWDRAVESTRKFMAAEAAGITAQALDLAAGVTVDPEAMESPGLPVPDDPAAISIFTAHRIDEVIHKLSHASQRMEAARSASGDLRKYHAARLAGHLKAALDAGHDLAANVRAHYPDEGDELDAVAATVGLARGYDPNARSGMISLDLPQGTVAPVPGGVTITEQALGEE